MTFRHMRWFGAAGLVLFFCGIASSQKANEKYVMLNFQDMRKAVFLMGKTDLRGLHFAGNFTLDIGNQTVLVKGQGEIVYGKTKISVDANDISVNGEPMGKSTSSVVMKDGRAVRGFPSGEFE
jgi:hypothetical protein